MVGTKVYYGCMANSFKVGPITLQKPLCERCHDLTFYNGRGDSILHPSIESIRHLLGDSPYKHNHVYHILDAVDFPLSLIPGIHKTLSLAHRSQNRRAQGKAWSHGQKTEMSFVITRADLLFPAAGRDADRTFQTMVEILRDAMGHFGENLRMGNIKCVSSMRGWYVKPLKEEIAKRGQGNWLVGRVNVGKSHLYTAIFPKGSIPDQETPSAIGPEVREDLEEDGHDTNALLPPVPKEEPFPVMPTVSHLPGTTALPVRHLFGNGKGELIDLPGLPRGNLEAFVEKEHRLSLVMRHRIFPTQFSLRPDESLLVSNLFRLTIANANDHHPNDILLAAAFVPLDNFATSTERAIDILAQNAHPKNPGIALPSTATTIASAGTFTLQWDVTKTRSGPLTRKDSAALSPTALPFVIFSADILIESVGWIEVAMQVRKRVLEEKGEQWRPAVEVFSPEGKFVGVRRPLGIWTLGRHGPKPVSRRKARPRRSMKGVKKALKIAHRAELARQKE
jgi:genetic interactor of prohibitins 3, mitochondrial